MRSEEFSRSCGDNDATSTALAQFVVNVEMNQVTYPVETVELILASLTLHLVEAFSQAFCTSSESLGISSVVGDIADFEELGSCVSINRMSKTCTTYNAVINIKYDPRDFSFPEAEDIDNACAVIESNINKTSILASINSSFDDFSITELVYQGTKASSQDPLEAGDSWKGSSDSRSTNLNPLGITMVSFVGIMVCIIFVLALFICRSRSRISRRTNPVMSGESKMPSNAKGIQSMAASGMEPFHAGRDSKTEGTITLVIPLGATSCPRTFVDNSSSKKHQPVLGEFELHDGINKRIGSIDDIGNFLESGANGNGHTGERQTKLERSAHASGASISRPVLLFESLENSTKKASSLRLSLLATRKTESSLVAKIVEEPYSEEEDKLALNLMQRVDDMLSKNVPKASSVEFHSLNTVRL